MSIILYKISSLRARRKALDEVEANDDIINIRNSNGNIEISIELDSIKEYMKISKITTKRVIDLANNILNIKFTIREGIKYYSMMPLFKRISINDNTLIFILNDEFEKYLIDLENNFMLWELTEFCKVRSKHSQNLYLLGKRYSSINNGKIRLKIKTFCEYMGISYSSRIYDIERILKKSIEEIKENTALQISYFKEKTKNKVSYINFEFIYSKELYKPVGDD